MHHILLRTCKDIILPVFVINVESFTTSVFVGVMDQRSSYGRVLAAWPQRRTPELQDLMSENLGRARYIAYATSVLLNAFRRAWHALYGHHRSPDLFHTRRPTAVFIVKLYSILRSSFGRIIVPRQPIHSFLHSFHHRQLWSCRPFLSAT